MIHATQVPKECVLPSEPEENETGMASMDSDASWKTNSFYAEWESAEGKQPGELNGVQGEATVAEIQELEECSWKTVEVFPEWGPAEVFPTFSPASPPMSPPLMMQPPPFIGYAMMPVAAAPTTAETHTASRTTVMWRNLPNNYTRAGLLELICSHGFAGCFDFFYAPVDFKTDSLLGYAFINFVFPVDAERFFDRFQRFVQWGNSSTKESLVAWSEHVQGKEAHVERYRNSQVMHPSVSDSKRPILLSGGMRIPFPPPTQKLRAPHFKECRPGK